MIGRNSVTGILAALAVLGSSGASAQTIAITNARVHTISAQGTLERATVLIRDGRIAAVGSAVDVPRSAEVFDAAGRDVTPGFFDAWSWFGVEEISLVHQTVDRKQSGSHFTASFDVSLAINPRSTLIPINRIGGVTRAAVVPGSDVKADSDVLAGQAAVIHLGQSDDYLVRRGAAMVAVLGETGARLEGDTRVNALLRLREALEDARDFAANRRAYESRARRDYALSRKDLEALQPVLAQRIPLIVSAHRAADIEQAIAVARQFDLRLVVEGGTEAWIVADRLAEVGASVIVDPLKDLPQRYEMLGATLENAARLHAAGVPVAFTTDETHYAANIRQRAGVAVAYGLPFDAALAGLTVNAAKIYGVDGDYGRLAPRQVADVVIWSGDPLEVTTYADQVFIQGVAIEMTSRSERLLERYIDLDRERPPAYTN